MTTGSYTARSARCLLGVFVACLALGQTGCGSKEPFCKTHGVRGRVLTADGQPLTAGLIEFRSTTDSMLSTFSTLQEDGAFELVTSNGRERLPGAVAGSYQVTILPSKRDTANATTGPEQRSDEPPIVLPQTYEVLPTDDNHFTIQLPK